METHSDVIESIFVFISGMQPGLGFHSIISSWLLKVVKLRFYIWLFCFSASINTFLDFWHPTLGKIAERFVLVLVANIKQNT